MEQIKVLIADDEKDIIDIMAKKVRDAGYVVFESYDGQDAWDKIETVDPDVILLDLTMPKMDGFEVLKKLREDPPLKKWRPVIIVSAKGELDDMKKGFSLEADHYITKPCKMEDVLKAIRLMVGLIPQRKSSMEIEA